MQLSEIWIYPIKSLGGIKLTSAETTERGLKNDRRWLLVDEHNGALTQRQFPQMALFQPAISENILSITHLKNTTSPLLLSLDDTPNGEKMLVKVWDDVMEAIEVSAEASAWFSEALGMITKLVYMPEQTQRKVDAKYAVLGTEITSFADAYPFLIIGQAALDELNSRLVEALPMNRFRPNLVFTGGTPHEEENWYEITVGNAKFTGVKPCARCVMTTIDQQKGENSGKEPLYTLARYRKAGKRILFGQNLVITHLATLQIGDALTVISEKKMPAFQVES